MTCDDDILIVGAGFAGLGMAIRLKRAGIENFTLLEQSDRLGGTWRDNHYPGAACDVESHLYSFSFEPNPSWTRQFATQSEILAYLDRCADKYGLRPHIRHDARVTSATFDETSGRWQVRTSDGEPRSARVLISCCGFLNRPSLPDIPGIATFAGETFHSSRWDDRCELAGKRVAIIGTGASAIQIVPAIASRVGHLSVFQRTPPWILPRRDREIPERERERFRRAPVLQRLARIGQYWRHEILCVGFVVEPRILKLGERLAVRFLERSVADPVLRAKLTPSFTLGCKRVLISNDYYPALQRSNVELVSAGITEIRPRTILTHDGVERPVDALVLATGFHAAEMVAPYQVRGRGGRDLEASWQGGAEAYLGTSVAGFPNLFFIIGPNTGLGHSSMVYMIESQVAYIESAIRTMRERGLKSIDVRAETQITFNEELQSRFPRTVWSTGCTSWYQTRTGRNTTLWPGFTFEFRLKTRRLDPEKYELERA